MSGAALFSCGPNSVSNNSSLQILEELETNKLIDEQIKSLKNSKIRINKRVFLNGDTETNVVGPFDSTRWARELALFKKIDITSPSVYSKYKVIQGTATRATLMAHQKNTLKSISILSESGKKTITAVLSDDPFLFKTGKKLKIILDTPNDSTTLLSEYHVTGFQKMITKDSVTYSVHSKLIRK